MHLILVYLFGHITLKYEYFPHIAYWEKASKLMVSTNLYFSWGINASVIIKTSKILDLRLKHLFYLDILIKISLKLDLL